jgi:hypothetical protein
MVVINMAMVIEKPYAAPIASEVLKYNTANTQPIQSTQLILGIYICPRILVGYLTVTLGQKFSNIASLISVYEPLIRAWLAMIHAAVAKWY